MQNQKRIVEQTKVDNYVRKLGEALTDARYNAKLTQTSLAEITGIAQADISRLENGNANPSIRTLLRLAEGIECRLEVAFVDADGARSEVVV